MIRDFEAKKGNASPADTERFIGRAAEQLGAFYQAGGQVLVANDAPELIEGSWHGKRTVLLEFESVETARNWYRSAEYQGLAGPRRHAAADSNAVIVAGFKMPTG